MQSQDSQRMLKSPSPRIFVLFPDGLAHRTPALLPMKRNRSFGSSCGCPQLFRAVIATMRRAAIRAQAQHLLRSAPSWCLPSEDQWRCCRPWRRGYCRWSSRRQCHRRCRWESWSGIDLSVALSFHRAAARHGWFSASGRNTVPHNAGLPAAMTPSPGVLGAISILLACLVDRLLGDPMTWPHPVVIMGWWINRLRGIAEHWS